MSELLTSWSPSTQTGRPPALFWGWISQTVWSGHTLRWAGFSSHSWKVWIRGIWVCVTAQLFLCTPGTPKAPETPKSFKAVVVVSLAGAELPNSWSLGAPSVSDFTPLLLRRLCRSSLRWRLTHETSLHQVVGNKWLRWVWLTYRAVMPALLSVHILHHSVILYGWCDQRQLVFSF